ncbi:MAG TPA: hypothetical protein PLZ93_01110 [Nocardioides sp.]|mgnify:CR=1 FL=1|uniref:hypothetical protein n=1 Tax=uncultured Nocardioides sp. TaxID=198441 RepID=UPI000ED1BDB8|nr:hypothetical protein [uncultured Nocardioides sp.]HCB03138.1 hypothetical protein [Nocardioides sp.]HRD60945.1 hypothetical protein [Nocardioides sp.]HRI94191.1 hypothetical protein [Nocardioides sp.]HRK44172.1 hypothetical protein [Nocardioides sp.]
MTTSRRAARAELRTTPVEGGPPAELYDVHAEVWRDFDLYCEWMRDHGWGAVDSDDSRDLPLRDRLVMVCGQGTHRDVDPADRRDNATERWAVANGLGQPEYPGFPDWGRLREMGLIR